MNRSDSDESRRDELGREGGGKREEEEVVCLEEGREGGVGRWLV